VTIGKMFGWLIVGCRVLAVLLTILCLFCGYVFYVLGGGNGWSGLTFVLACSVTVIVAGLATTTLLASFVKKRAARNALASWPPSVSGNLADVEKKPVE